MRPNAGIVRNSLLLPAGFLLGLLSVGTIAVAASDVAPLPILDAQDRYTVISQDLHDVFSQFCEDMHLRVSISESVKGRVRGRISAPSPRKFLDLVTQLYGLDWYYDGYMLSVTASSEGETRLLDTSGLDMATLQKALDVAGVSDVRFPLRLLPGTRRVLISGPPHFVDLVLQTAAALAPQPSGPAAASGNYTVVYRGAATQRVGFDR